MDRQMDRIGAGQTPKDELDPCAHILPHWHGKCYYLLFVWLA